MNTTLFTDAIISQYKAALSMLRNVISRVPEDMWNSEEQADTNKSWRLLYHTIWSTQYYLNGKAIDSAFWERAIPGAESLGGAWEDPQTIIPVKGTNSPEELLGFLEDIEANLEMNVKTLPLEQPSGFEWYPYSRFELHINNIRHIQHHTGEIIERLKNKGYSGFDWAIDGNPPAEW